MVCIDLFDTKSSYQFIKTLIAFIILSIGDYFYIYITNNLKKFNQHKFAYLITWFVIAFIIGISTLKNDNGDTLYDGAKRDYIYYGILLAIVIYTPLNSWLYSVKFTNGYKPLYYTTYGIFLISFTSLITFMISQNNYLVR